MGENDYDISRIIIILVLYDNMCLRKWSCKKSYEVIIIKCVWEKIMHEGLWGCCDKMCLEKGYLNSVMKFIFLYILFKIHILNPTKILYI